MIKTKIFEINDSLIHQTGHKVFTSAEGDNPGGSIKDHMVFNELTELLRLGKLKKTDWISEISSGSTALSLAHYAKHFELSCHLFVPKDMAPEKIKQLESYGAKVHQCNVETIYQDHNNFLTEHPRTVFFNQFFDEKKIRHYKKLGAFFSQQVGPFDLVIGAVGTGHSLKGIAGANSEALLYSAEPAPSEKCLGVRNIEVENYGPQDPCHVNNFQHRVIVNQKNYFPKDIVDTTGGRLRICESFRLVLGAIQVLPVSKSSRSILALGAQNHFLIYK